VALLYGGLSVGADAMQRSTGTPSSIVFILQALLVLLVLASPVALRYRLRRAGPAAVASAVAVEPRHG
jgi:simple sugar transport system permease protein